MWKLKSIIAVSSRQTGHHTIFGNISLFQIHQKLKKVVQRLQQAIFGDKTFSGCCTTRATAHILGRPVLGQTKAGILSCIVINKKDDDWRGILKNTLRALSKVIREKEEAAASEKRKQALMV